MDDIINEKMLKFLLKKAEKASKKGEIPVSALIFDKEGKIISWEINRRQGNYNVLGHAEILAILKAEKKINDWRLNGYSMLVSLEPCDMCSLVISESRLDHVYYIVSKKSNSNYNSFDISKSKLDGFDDYEGKFNKLLTDFFDDKR